MYLQYVEVEVKPEKLGTFLAYSRAFLGAIARQPGGVWFRILRFTENPLVFASVRIAARSGGFQTRLPPCPFLNGKEGRGDEGFAAYRRHIVLEQRRISREAPDVSAIC